MPEAVLADAAIKDALKAERYFAITASPFAALRQSPLINLPLIIYNPVFDSFCR